MDSQLSPQIPRILITPDQLPTRNELPKPAPQAVLSADKASGGASGEGKSGFWGSDGFGFDDLLDFINPLQHIPVVSTVYRAITGDEIGIGPRMFGGAVLGGVVGVGIAAANAAIEFETGKDIGETMLASAMDVGKKAVDVATGNGEAQVLAAANGLAPLPEIAQMAAPLSPASQAAVSAVPVPEVAINPVAATILGAAETANQSYRNAQFLDMLQETAMEMKA